jgi:hypothetical protein
MWQERIWRKMAEVSKSREVLVKVRLNDYMAYAICCVLGMS